MTLDTSFLPFLTYLKHVSLRFVLGWEEFDIFGLSGEVDGNAIPKEG